MKRSTTRLLAGLLGAETVLVIAVTILMVLFRSLVNRFGGGALGALVALGLVAAVLAVGAVLAVSAAGLWLEWQRQPGNRRFSDLLSMAAGVNFIGAVYVALVVASDGKRLGPVQVAAGAGAVMAVLAAYGCARAASAASRKRITTW